jgi:trehalose 6-phosphate phosphatase
LALPPEQVVERFRSLGRRAGIFLDFDGTLSDIAPRPDLARPRPEVGEILSGLLTRYALVAVASARPAEAVRSLLGLPEVHVFGLYGLREGAVRSPAIEAARSAAEEAANLVDGAWVEDKGQSLAVHFRQAANPKLASALLSERLSAAADAAGLALIAGKMVLELAPPDVPGKGSVIVRECRSRGLEGCLYAGDDLSDLDAFAALERLREEGLTVVRIAVRSEETPVELIDAADIVVDRPAGLMRFLARL